MRLGVTGHQTIPSAASDALRKFLVEMKGGPSPILVISSLAAGADQCAASISLELGGSHEVIVPCVNYESTFSHPSALKAYARLVESAAEVVELPYPGPSDEAFLAAGLVVVERSDAVLAIWDGAPARGLGGTADIVGYASKTGKRVHRVWPSLTS